MFRTLPFAAAGSILLALTAACLIACSDDNNPTAGSPPRAGFTWTAVASWQDFDDILRGVAVGPDSGFAAVGDSGLILISPDGQRLFQPSSGVSFNLIGVTRTGDGYAAVGESTYVLTSSPDGRDWTATAVSDTLITKGTWFAGIAANESRIVAVGKLGKIVTSSDGTTWESAQLKYYFIDTTVVSTDSIIVDTVGFVTPHLYSVSWVEGLGQFVATGSSGLVFLSPDGLTWTGWASATSQTLMDVAWSPSLSLLMAVGDTGVIVTSSTGKNWTLVEDRPDDWFYGVDWSGSDFVIVGGSGWILSSPDGETFTLRDASALTYRGICWTGEKFVAVGDKQTLSQSADGIKWDLLHCEATVNLSSVASAPAGSDTILFAVGSQGSILRADVDTTWRLAYAGPSVMLNGIACSAGSPGSCVAVGDEGTILVTHDLEQWDTVSVRPTSLDLYTVISYPSGFLAAGENGTVLTSSNGDSWQVAFPSDISLRNAVWSGSKVLIVGDSGQVIHSPTGQSWTVEHLGDTLQLRAVAWADSLFVAVGENYTILTSVDGLQWVKAERDSTLTLDLNAVAAADSVIVAAGYLALAVTSEDAGASWSLTRTTGVSVADLIWTGDHFVAVGSGSWIWTSP